MGLPFAAFPIASTNRAAEAEAILSREVTDLRLAKVRDRRAFGLRMHGVALGRVALLCNRFDTDTSIDVGTMERDVILALGSGPPPVFHVDGEQVVCSADGGIISPSREVWIERPAGSECLILKTSVGAIADRFQEMTDRRPSQPICFGLSVDLAAGVGADLRRLLRSTIAEIERGRGLVDNPILRGGLEDLMLSAILALPGDHSGELRRAFQYSAAPSLVRRAEEYLEANATEPVTISDVVAECGCSRSALFNAFRRYRDYTPAQFLAECRLKSAHAALQSPSPGDTVTSIAYALGFAHRGRFAEGYRKRFGKLPSDTLRKAEPTNGR